MRRIGSGGGGARFAALAFRLRLYRRVLRSTTSCFGPRFIASRLFGDRGGGQPFGQSAAIAERFRFVEPHELRAALQQFCGDFGLHDPASIAMMENNRVFHSSLVEYTNKRAQFLTPSPHRDALGHAAVDFMGLQALATLFGLDVLVNRTPIDVPLVDAMMSRGAHGLYTVGRCQFDALAQIAVDLRAWLLATGRTEVVLIEAPLGNSVPVAVLSHVFRAGGITVDIVEWGCPRNDRALVGRTVALSARDLATIPAVAEAPLLLFVDDAITGSRFLKMAKALRRAVGAGRFAAVAMRVRFNPTARFPTGQIRSLDVVDLWAADLGMPFGEIRLPDLPLFAIDEGAPGLLETALAWGDAGYSAGKRKVNILFNFLDRFEAIAKELGKAGQSDARDFLHRWVWNRDTSGARHVIAPDVGEAAHRRIVAALPADFFNRLRHAARQDFPHDYLGRAVLGDVELRRRTDWLARCISTAALPFLEEEEAYFIENAVNSLSQAGYTAGIDGPPRDHDYGLYTVQLAPGEDRLHLELVDLVVANAAARSPRAGLMLRSAR
jgi:hypothetical protein